MAATWTGQPECYRLQLDVSGAHFAALVLPTRSPSSALETALSSVQYRHVCWYRIHDWQIEVHLDGEASAFAVSEDRRILEGRTSVESRSPGKARLARQRRCTGQTCWRQTVKRLSLGSPLGRRASSVGGCAGSA